MAVGNAINENTTGIVGFTGTSFTATPVTQYNVLTGGATTSALNNVAPSATSGVPTISQGASSQPIFGTAVVAGGGTGNTTFTAFSIIAAGTAATNPFQNISGVGTSGQVLTSTGASALPTWQTVAAGGTSQAFILQQASATNPADGVTYFMANNSIFTLNTASTPQARNYIAAAGTINRVYGNLNVAGTLGTTENATLALRLNNTSNSNVTTTLQFNAVNTTFNTTTLGLSVSAGDFIEIIVICPTWVTNPTSVKLNLTFLVE